MNFPINLIIFFFGIADMQQVYFNEDVASCKVKCMSSTALNIICEAV